MEKKNTLTVIILRIAQPLLLLGGLFTYTLGLGIVHYLGTPIDWTNAVLGSLLVVLLILAKNFLAAYYTYPEQIPSPGFLKEAQEGEPDFISLKELQRSILLQIALVSLSVGAGATVLLIFRKALNLAEVFTLGVALILVYFSAVPPMRLDRRGYAELIESLLLANLFPAIALLLHETTVHVLLVMLTFPLTFLFLAYRIATSLEYYGYDLKHNGTSMVIRMGWQKGMIWHNLSVLLAFFLVGGFLLLRLPWPLAWPIFLALPLGILQIIQIQAITDGAKPHWWLLRLNALGTFAVATYLIAFTLWTH